MKAVVSERRLGADFSHLLQEVGERTIAQPDDRATLTIPSRMLTRSLRRAKSRAVFERWVTMQRYLHAKFSTALM